MQRLVLSSGREIVAHCAAVACAEAGRFADMCCDTVLWSRSAPDTWPLPRLLGLLERQPSTVAMNGPRAACRRIARDVIRLKARRVLYESVAREDRSRRPV